MRRTVIAVAVLVAAVAGGVVAARTAPDPRPDLLAALTALPGDGETANVTDWSAVRGLLDVPASAVDDPATLRRVLAQGFSTDLVGVSPLAEAAPVMADAYGWSVVGSDWEAFGQSRDGAVAVVSLGDVEIDDVLAGLAGLGYAAPDGDADDDGGVWIGGPDVVAAVDPALSPVLGHVAVLADEGLVVASDAPEYAEHTVAVIRGEEPSMADEPDVAATALRLLDDPVVVVHRGERGCAVTSLRTASSQDRVVARRLVDAGEPLLAYDALGLGLAVGEDGSALDVVLRFSDGADALAQEPVRVALTRGDALGQGGAWSDRFQRVEASVTGADLTLRLVSGDRQARMLSDLGTGGLLFASCPA